MPHTISLMLFLTLLVAIAFALPNACTTQAANEKAAIALHKESISGTYISASDQVVIDITDEDFKAANKHANAFLRANREK